MISGVLNIYKEKGYTSADVVARLRGILHQKKIGHTGTLDPDAEGVLPVVLGQATKLVEKLTDKSKEYICVCRLGITTDTEDMSGRVLARSDKKIAEAEVRECLEGFVGSYTQVPPMYSALKQGGKRLYELAREGIVVERPARQLTIHEIEMLDFEDPCFCFRVSCSRGTYVRSLCRDIGERLGCGGAMERLKRSRSGEFGIEDALLLGEVEKLAESGGLDAHIVPIEHFYRDIPQLVIRPQAWRFLQNGNALKPEHFMDPPALPVEGLYRVCDSRGHFVAVYRYYTKEKRFVAETMYLSAGD